MLDYKNLTLNQLKMICKYHGYEIYRQSHRPPRLPCPSCGLKRTVLIKDIQNNLYYRQCKRCHFLGYSSKSINGTSKTWNQSVEDFCRILNKTFV